MRVTKISSHELSFHTNGRDSNNRKFNLTNFSVFIPGTSEEVEMIRAKPANGDESFYYNAATNKERIVLHFTAGYLKGDIAALTKSNRHVSVPFVIARDGTIYNLFHSSKWSYHLGPGTIGGNKVKSKESIGIELSNIGPLVSKDGNMYSTYTNPNGEYFDVYCKESETPYYVSLDSPYRGYSHFATFTDSQYENLIKLLKYLTGKYTNISSNFIVDTNRYDATAMNAGFTGITSHVNFRKSGKWDIGPGFDWARVINGI